METKPKKIPLILMSKEEIEKRFNYTKKDFYKKYNNLVHKLARSFKLTRNIEYGDLVSAGWIGVNIAHSNKFKEFVYCKKLKEEIKIKISTYVYQMIYNEQTKEYRRMLNTLHIPYGTQTDMKFGYVRKKYLDEIKLNPDITEEEKEELKIKFKINRINQVYESDILDLKNIHLQLDCDSIFDELVSSTIEIKRDIKDELNELLFNKIITNSEVKILINFYYNNIDNKEVKKITLKIEEYRNN